MPDVCTHVKSVGCRFFYHKAALSSQMKFLNGMERVQWYIFRDNQRPSKIDDLFAVEALLMSIIIFVEAFNVCSKRY